LINLKTNADLATFCLFGIFRFSRRQAERKSRKQEVEEAEASRDRSRSGTPLRSSSPAASKTIIEAAIARKNNVNNTNRSSFVKQGKRDRRHKMKKSSRDASKRSFSRESKSPRSSGVAPSKTRKAEQLTSSLDFGMAALSENQQKSLNAEQSLMREEEQSSKFSKRNKSLDLTCSESMSLDIENLSTSPGSLHDDSPSVSADSSEDLFHQEEEDVQETTSFLESGESEIIVVNSAKIQPKCNKKQECSEKLNSNSRSKEEEVAHDDTKMEDEEILEVDFEEGSTREELLIDNASSILSSADYSSSQDTEEFGIADPMEIESRGDVEKVIQDILTDVEEHLSDDAS